MENILSIISHFEKKESGDIYSYNCSVHRDEDNKLYITKSSLTPDERIGINSRMNMYQRQEDSDFTMMAAVIANELSNETASLATYFYQEGFNKPIIQPNSFEGMYLFLLSKEAQLFAEELNCIQTQFIIYCADKEIKQIIRRYLRMITRK